MSRRMSVMQLPVVDDFGAAETPETLCIQKETLERWFVSDPVERERLHRKWNVDARRIKTPRLEPVIEVPALPAVAPRAETLLLGSIETFRCRPFTTRLSITGCVARHQRGLRQGRKELRAGVPLLVGGEQCARCALGEAHARGHRPASWDDGTAVERFNAAGGG